MAKHKRIPALRTHHEKPYRRRHLLALAAAFALLFVSAVQIGVVIGRNQQQPASTPEIARLDNAGLTSDVPVRSDYGFGLTVDRLQFQIEGRVRDAAGRERPASDDELASGTGIVSATMTPRSGIEPRLAASRLRVTVSPESGRAVPPPISPSGLAVQKLAKTTETLGGTALHKTTYEFSDIRGGKSGKSYTIVWDTTIDQYALAITLEGLIGDATVPTIYDALLGTLQLSSSQGVLGVRQAAAAFHPRDNQLDARYLADALSPAVVQIFHTVCGILTMDGQQLGDSNCLTMTGSGFLVSPDGYIATNGHVVVYGAKDVVANMLASNQTVLRAYLRGQGLTANQIAATTADPSAVAAQISKVYDLPDSQLQFSDKGEQWLVVLGGEAPDAKQLLNLKTKTQLAALRYDASIIKPAKVVGYNYSAKDVYTTVANPAYGFSSSDVALLKVSVRSAPALSLETDHVLRNQKVMVMGFPGDAGNPLIDNSQTDVTVTNGVISAIRQAAGGKGKLYQSDADASHGNSGGPAIDEAGRVIGLLTYRYTDGEQGNAAKSYIRDITDFSDLARAYNVRLAGDSQTQQLWEEGLAEYSHNHYSVALANFQAVQTAYPAHRLVASYIDSSRQAIKAGKDVKDPPVGWLAAVTAAALLLTAWVLRLIIRHRAAHHLYMAGQEFAAQQTPEPPQQLLQ